ncbi:MAG: GRAM domain-containing protein [Bacteroidota bacterium]
MEIATKPVRLNLKSKIVITIASALVYSLLIVVIDLFVEADLFFSAAGPLLILVLALFFGFVFPDFLAHTMSKSGMKNTLGITPDLDENEAIMIEGPASLINGNAVLGGKIFLTGSRMIFRNTEKEQIHLPYPSIKHMKVGKTAGIIENKLNIITLEKERYHFIVNQPKLWIEKLSQLKTI